MLTETVEGKGTLRGADGITQYEVSYRFDITTRVIDRPGFPRVEAEKRSTGTVKSLTGEVIPLGYYDLHTPDEILHVKNMGSWHIVAG
jgi:hypothetical protein